MAVYKKAQKGNATLTILYDEDAQNPRTEFEHLGHMICWHRRYNLGDKHNYSEPRDFLESLAQELSPLASDTIEKKKTEELVRVIEQHAIVLPIYAYEHGDITIRTAAFSDPWDSGQLGWIYITNEEIRKEYSVKRISKQTREKAKSVLEGEIKEYDIYLRGEVFGYVLEVDGVEKDSCWGFFGSDHIEEELKHSLEDAYVSLVEELNYVY